MDFMCRVVERSDVSIRRRLLSCLQNSELRMVQDLARIIDFGIANCNCLCRRHFKIEEGGYNEVVKPQVFGGMECEHIPEKESFSL